MIKKLRKRLLVIFTIFTGLIIFVVLFIAYILSIGQQQLKNQYRRQTNIVNAINLATYYDDPSQLAVLNELEKNERLAVVVISEKGEILYKTQSWEMKTDAETLYEQSKENKDILYYGTMVALDSPQEDEIQTQNDNSEETTLIKNALYYQDSEEYYEYDFGGTILAGKNGGEYAVLNMDVEYLNTSGDFIEEESNKTQVELPQLISQEDRMYHIYLFQDLAIDTESLQMLTMIYIALFIIGLLLLLVVNYFLTKIAVKPTESSLQDQTEFIAAASHELKNPLAVIRTSLSAVEISENKQEAEKYLKVIDSEAVRMSRLVEELLILAGSKTGKWKMRLQKVDVDTLLIETVERVNLVAKEENVKVKLDLPEEIIGELNLDKDRIQQVLYVLLDNALQYSSANSEVELKVEKEKATLKIFVIDHGKGIDKKDRKNIFKKFYRSETSHTDKSHFGLGLSVAQELVEMHSGKIILEDTPYGGATFIVSLPYKNRKK